MAVSGVRMVGMAACMQANDVTRLACSCPRSAVQVCASVLQYGLLTYLVSTNNITTLSVWAVIKVGKCTGQRVNAYAH